MCQLASSATCFGAVAQTKGIRCSRPSSVRGTAVLALNGELRGQAPGGDGRARTAAQSAIRFLWAEAGDAEDTVFFIHQTSNILTPSIRYLEHSANGLQKFSPANT